MVLRVAFPYLPSAAALAWVLGTGLAAAVEPAPPVPPASVPGSQNQAPSVQAAPVPPAPVEPTRREVTASPEPLPGGATPLPVGPIKPGAAPRPGEARPAEPKPAETKAAEGKAPPKKVSRELPPLVVARMSQDTTPTLTPATFLDTLRAAERYQGLVEAGGWPALPADLAVKPGERNPAIPLLRRHLVLTEDLAPGGPEGDALDPGLVAALKRYQARHNLPETGLLGRQTVAALNVPAGVRQRQLAASANRLIGSSFPFGERYVVVNIPSAAVEAVDHGSVARRYVAVVGKPERASPSVETKITNINFNPTWTVPVSLIKKDIIPHMRKDPGYLAKMHIRMLDGQGQEVQPTAVDWSTERAVNYTLRQDPGFDNSLGQVRIDMPNRHAVYMHDTPSKSLFTRDVRFHSSGCVRVADVKALVGWLLDGTPGPNGPGSAWGPMEIETGIATGERRDIKLAKPVPVTFVYLTGYATPDGRVHFRDDVYGLDTGKPADVAVTGALAKPDTAKPDTAKPGSAKPAARPVPAGIAAETRPTAKPTATKPGAAKSEASKPAAVKAPSAEGTAPKAEPKPGAKASAPEKPASSRPTPAAERRSTVPPT
ncbi:Putative peptidoglycan binding domain-containing protein [Methylobacterium sp. 174MFSha1.1]|uniref:L,D-transpeptidase family protein n=1 Tax=Methylobacterium sp. 174MFSha1.1 TaxID=1502749 RepID=UPI0008EF73C2|nr:L,D-transpeptidase family protein [Methylobacterium sp. 174MFSha1.1]SFV09745.1 Putative peptidoglycan binding domain-containing protein [Methylobacterium sp. 174MFSha1.1]